MDTTETEVIDALKISGRHLSIDAPFNIGDSNRLLDVLKNDSNVSPDHDLYEKSLSKEIKIALSSLKEREKEVIVLYYGIEQRQSLTLEEIGDILNLTRERVRQIKEKALKRLRHNVRSKPLRAYLG